MATLNINGKRVKVDDSFLNLSPEQQQAAVEEIAAQIGAAEPQRSLGDMLYENIIGRGEVDTPGERLGQIIEESGKALPAAIARGAAERVGFPGTLGNWLDIGYEKAGLIPEGAAAQHRSPISGETIRGVLSNITGGATEFRGESAPARVVGAIGEFIGGGTGVRPGIVGGAASELAGMATEGTALEPWARFLAGVGGSVLASPRPKFAGDDRYSRMANLLEEKGIRGITAGQARRDHTLRRLEGRLEPTAQQLDDYTASVMRQLGSDAKFATPEALKDVQNRLLAQMDDATRGLDIVPNPTAAQRAAEIGADYIERVPSGDLTPRIQGIAREIDALAKRNSPVSLDRLRTWRSDIGDFTTAKDTATRNAAHALRSIIDDMTDETLRAAGRADDIALLAQARSSYRDFIAVRDAASRAGAEAGTLSPAQLNQSIIRFQGRENYATGRTTDMADFTRAGASVLRPSPTTLPGGGRSWTQALPVVGASAAGGGALYAGLDPAVAAFLAAGGAALPAASQAAMRSYIVQNLLRDPIQAVGGAMTPVPGLLAQ